MSAIGRHPPIVMSRLAAVALLFFAGAVAAQDPASVRGENPQTRKRLAEAEQKLAAKPADALDDLLALLDSAADDLVPAGDGSLLVPARQFVHRFLARLPTDQLKTYRDRVEVPAGQLLAAGQKSRSDEPLLRLLDRYAVSRPAEDARLLLAELAFERGEFATAERWWASLLPDADPPYPAARTDPARLRANVILAVLFQGHRDRAVPLFNAFRQQHPTATGPFAGRPGPIADTLQALLANPPAVRPDTLGGGTWTTFAGRDGRDGRTNGRFDPNALPSRPTWIVDLPHEPVADLDPRKPAALKYGVVRGVGFHPIAAGGTVYVADTARLFAVDPKTADARVVFDARKDAAVPDSELRLPLPINADFTLTAAGGRVFGRFGTAALFPASERGPRVSPPRLIGVGKEVWARKPPGAAGEAVAWEGAPVAAGGRLFAVAARSEAGRLVHTAVAFDPDSESPVWAVDLCDAAAAGGAEARTRHELATVAGRNLVFCSHAGAVVAVNRETGKPAWAYRYPRVRRLPFDGRHRDLCPPVFADGRVFVAPTDSDRVLAFDAESGRPLWQDGPVEVDHLIGAAGGKLVAAIAGPARGVRGYDAATGSTDSPHGWRQHDDPYLTGFGRGLLTDDSVLWPTVAGVFVLRLSDGLPTGRRLYGPHGNLAFADGTLLVGTPMAVWGYVLPGGPGVRPEPPPVRAVFQESTRPTVRPVLKFPLTATPVEWKPDAAQPGIAFRGEHQLVGFRPSSDRPAWQLDPRKRTRDWPFALDTAPRFGPHLYADTDRILAQTSDGRRLLLDAKTGRVIAEAPTAQRAWSSPPVRLGDRLIVSDGPAAVTALHPLTGRTDWKYDAGREASQTGDPARPAVADDKLFVLVARNQGSELDRLNPITGRSEWKAGPALLPGLTDADPDANGERVYVPTATALHALRADTGRPAWEATLPFSADWRCAVAANTLLVYPATGVPVEPLDTAAERLFLSFVQRPLPYRLFGLLATFAEVWHDRTLPVLLLDPKDGRVMQRLDLTCRGPAVRVDLAPDRVTVRAGAAAYRLQ